MKDDFALTLSSGDKISKAVLPLTFGKRWERQPTFTQLWFYGLALRMKGECYAVHCRFSREDLRSLLNNADPRTWLNNQFSIHLRGVSRVLVFEASEMTRTMDCTSATKTDLHMHGVVCVEGTDVSESELKKRLQAIFVGRGDNSKRGSRFYNLQKAIKIESCHVDRRHKTSKHTVVGHAMGLLGYASKDTAKTKRAWGITDDDIPNWFYNSKLMDYFPDSTKQNQAFFRGLMSASRGLGSTAKALFDEMYEKGYVRIANDYDTLEVRKIIDGLAGLSTEDVNLIRRLEL